MSSSLTICLSNQPLESRFLLLVLFSHPDKRKSEKNKSFHKFLHFPFLLFFLQIKLISISCEWKPAHPLARKNTVMAFRMAFICYAVILSVCIFSPAVSCVPYNQISIMPWQDGMKQTDILI